MKKIKIQQLFQHLNDGDPEVRDSSCMAFGSIMRLVHGKELERLTDGSSTDKVKMKKFVEYCEIAEKMYEEKFEGERTEIDGPVVQACTVQVNTHLQVIASSPLFSQLYTLLVFLQRQAVVRNIFSKCRALSEKCFECFV